jgi:hypothetical protein
MLRTAALPTKLGPQQVEAIASLPACDPYTGCFDFGAKWYLIRTSWLGEKWIYPYRFAEKYKGEPVEGYISIEDAAPVLLYPEDQPLADEPNLLPRIVKPIAKYVRMQRMVPPVVWYQIETEKGLRWVRTPSEHGLGFENIEPVDRKIEFPVSFQYYKTPVSGEPASRLQEPQTVHALGHRGDWYFVLTEGTGRWINPAMEVAKRITGEFDKDSKLGVQWSREEVQLTAESIGLDQPYVEEWRGQELMTFTPQKVTASRVWHSPNGETWYYIHTWQGAKWVRP